MVFYGKLYQYITSITQEAKGLRAQLLEADANYVEILSEAQKKFDIICNIMDGKLLEAFDKQNLKDWLLAEYAETFEDNSMLSDDCLIKLTSLQLISNIQHEITTVKNADFREFISGDISDWAVQENIQSKNILAELAKLSSKLEELENADRVSADHKEAASIWAAEEKLLADIRAIDKDHDFYYTAPVDLSLAIEFNESNDSLNTLMNPAINYDINNINNNFVISKLDINYLDSGLQIARSSRLN